MTLHTELMYPTEFFYRYAIEPGYLQVKAPGVPVDVSAGSLCYVCGRDDFTTGYMRNDVIMSSFTNQDLCVAPSGIHVCKYCANTLSDIVRKVSLCLVTRERCFTVAADDISLTGILQNPPEPPFLLYKSDGKKHTIFRSRVTTSNKLIYAYIIHASKSKGKIIASFDRLFEINRDEIEALTDDVKHLAEVIGRESGTFGVLSAKFGRGVLQKLSQEDLALYNKIKNSCNRTTSKGLLVEQYLWEGTPKTRAAKKVRKQKKR